MVVVAVWPSVSADGRAHYPRCFRCASTFSIYFLVRVATSRLLRVLVGERMFPIRVFWLLWPPAQSQTLPREFGEFSCAVAAPVRHALLGSVRVFLHRRLTFR
jgi:hypothetical protein